MIHDAEIRFDTVIEMKCKFCGVPLTPENEQTGIIFSVVIGFSEELVNGEEPNMMSKTAWLCSLECLRKYLWGPIYDLQAALDQVKYGSGTRRVN